MIAKYGTKGDIPMNDQTVNEVLREFKGRVEDTDPFFIVRTCDAGCCVLVSREISTDTMTTFFLDHDEALRLIADITEAIGGEVVTALAPGTPKGGMH